MAKNITMNAKDAIAAKLAKCFITLNGNRYNFANMIDMEVKLEKQKSTIPNTWCDYDRTQVNRYGRYF